MNRLRRAALAAGRGAVLPVLSEEKLLAIEHAAAMLDRRPRPTALATSAIARPSQSPKETAAGIEALSSRELSRALNALWSRTVPDGLPKVILDLMVARAARSCDRAIIECYFLHYPIDHADFVSLRLSVETVAERHDWRWRSIGRDYRLWREDAADRCAALIRASDDPGLLLREIGLVGRLAEGRFASRLMGAI